MVNGETGEAEWLVIIVGRRRVIAHCPGWEKGGNKAELHRGILYIKKLEFGDMEF